MQHTPLPAPLYHRVFGVLYQRIRQGEYPVGTALASEDSLAAELSVSKATIRKAVDELVVRGLIVRRQGKGTFVRRASAEDAGEVFVGSFMDLISGTPGMPVRDVSIETGVRIPEAVRAELGLAGEAGTVVRNRRTVGGVVFVLSTHYLSPAIAAFANDPRLRTEGLLTVLHEGGVALTGAEQSVSAQLADVDVAAALEIDLGAAVLFSKRILESADGPVDVLHSWYRGDLYEWRSRLSIGKDGALRLAPRDEAEKT